MNTTVGIIGGTGPFGRAFAARAASLGYEVLLGSRDAARAEAAAARVGAERIRGVENAAALEDADIIVVAVPFDAHQQVLEEFAPWIGSRVLLDVTVPVSDENGPKFVPQPRSFAEASQEAAPYARVVSAFHTVAASILRQVDRQLDQDVFLCGGDAGGKAVVTEMVERAGGRLVDCGDLVIARVLEGLGAVLTGLNVRYKKRHLGIRVAGL